MYGATLTFAIAPGVVSTVFDYLMPLNVSRPKVLSFYAEFFIDQQKHYYELLCCTYFSFAMVVSIYTTIDSTYSCCVQHIVGLFSIVE